MFLSSRAPSERFLLQNIDIFHAGDEVSLILELRLVSLRLSIDSLLLIKPEETPAEECQQYNQGGAENSFKSVLNVSNINEDLK